ncbi:MAG UNVERIFIED_CONTAM: exodeoxyribonuclease III [Rickettsiaceae bacterium]|jgi:exodeoxyribonuclease-3
MKIATWNINSIRIRMDLIKAFIEKHNPDVIAFQETKVADYAFPVGDCISLGYKHIRFSGEKSYNGVAIFSKYPIKEEFSLEFYNGDKRHLAVKIGDIEIHNFYIPAGGDEPDVNINPKFKHKLAYLDEMHEWFLDNRKKDQKIILLGDLNIAPLEHDVWSSKQLKYEVSHTDIERQKLMRNLNEFGFIDSSRFFVPDSEKLYSWWSYRSPDWERSDRGRRLDHIWLTPSLAGTLNSSIIEKEMRKHPSPSDHVPVLVNLG